MYSNYYPWSSSTPGLAAINPESPFSMGCVRLYEPCGGINMAAKHPRHLLPRVGNLLDLFTLVYTCLTMGNAKIHINLFNHSTPWPWPFAQCS